MRSLPLLKALTLTVAIALAGALASSAGASSGNSSIRAATGAGSKLTPRLAALATPAVQGLSDAELAQVLSLPPDGPGALLRAPDGVLVDVRVADTSDDTLKQLEAAGGRIIAVAPEYRIVTLAVAPTALLAVAAVPAVSSLAEELTPMSASNMLAPGGLRPATVAAACFGAATTEGDTQLKAAQARNKFHVDGTGVMVGVLSDSFDLNTSDSTSAFGDIGSSDIPGPANPCGHTTPVNVLQESFFGGIDEGRAMLQIVHDIAPGANLAFASAFNGMYTFAQNIRALEQAGADVIVDDVTYFQEPMFQRAPVDIAIDEVTAAGAVYYSSAGNSNVIVGGNNIASWEAPAFRPGACPAEVAALIPAGATCMDFDPGAGIDTKFDYTLLGSGGRLNVDLQWSEPWFGVNTDFDVFFTVSNAVVASSRNSNGTTGMPFEFSGVMTSGPGSVPVQVVIARVGGTGTPRLKYVLTRANVSSAEFPAAGAGDIFGPTINGHNGSPNAMSVAAVPFNNSGIAETYSSHGPVTHYWGPAASTIPAAPLGAPQVLAKPDLAATDGGANTFFGQFDGSNFRFFGTSAAAPHAAGVAALMRDAFPALTAAQVKTFQRNKSVPVGAFPATVVGAGLTDANQAVAAVVPTVSISDRTLAEDNSGTKAFNFTVTLSKVSAAQVKVKFQTFDTGATAGSDYVAKTGTLTFAPGQTSKTVTITVNGDTTPEPNETFEVRLSIPLRVRIVDGIGVGTITNDD